MPAEKRVVTEDKAEPTTAAKKMLRRFIPEFLLAERSIVSKVGPKAGRIYAELRALDLLGMRSATAQRVPPSTRSFLFVCFGNIMRSAMAESLMRQAIQEMAPEKATDVRIVSAGIHATEGKEAHEWAQTAALDLGMSLQGHRAKPLTREMVDKADCILAMDFQNKAELLTLYPDAQKKIYMLSAYAEGPWHNRQIPDPYFGDVDVTRFCAQQLRICVRNLIATTICAP